MFSFLNVAPLPSPATAVQPPVSAPTGSGDLQLSSLPSPSDPCKKINDFLSESPSLQTWYKLLQASLYLYPLSHLSGVSLPHITLKAGVVCIPLPDVEAQDVDVQLS